MKFTKMHGLGNDYVYVETFSQSPPRRSRQPGGERSATGTSASAPMG